MGTRRSHLLVLLLVLGLVAVSGIIIASKETKLGLDLQGGLELVYQGQATGEDTEVTGEDIEDSISIIEERINKLGVSEPEVARLGVDQITVSLPGVTDANRAAEQVGTTAQLYYYDWEPNLIGPEKAIGGDPTQSSEKAFEESRSNSILARRSVQLAGGDDRGAREPAAGRRWRDDLADLGVLAQHRAVEGRADVGVLQGHLGHAHGRFRRLELRLLQLHARVRRGELRGELFGLLPRDQVARQEILGSGHVPLELVARGLRFSQRGARLR